MHDGDVLRLLDANLNRAREGLRVLEDAARFIANNAPLAARLKSLRHDLASATASLAQAALPFRNTAHDVGTTNKTPAESHRPHAHAVTTAAAKRLAEALRSIEEYAKVVAPAVAPAVEKLRYRFYDLERDLLLPPPPRPLASIRLYVLITESACLGNWFDTARHAIDGGAGAIQLREKSLDAAPLLDRAHQLAQLCAQANVLFVLNDRADLASAIPNAGLHLGQSDLPPHAARRILGHDKTLGLSTHNPDQLQAAIQAGANYVGVGPVFPSNTKPRNFLPGLDYAKSAAQLSTIPTFAIGGITPINAPQVFATGVTGIAVTAAITQSPNPKLAAQQLLQSP